MKAPQDTQERELHYCPDVWECLKADDGTNVLQLCGIAEFLESKDLFRESWKCRRRQAGVLLKLRGDAIPGVIVTVQKDAYVSAVLGEEENNVVTTAPAEKGPM
ncbi:hypothetical protein K0M31_019863 [Melipona bicolor]|uniref:Uncharacterized protein n=1 Tax=Melipona bicolor TaxID=60889 RepID=A0AA40KQA0_9HYME|nr:hypothetical protein K0M31_019863 [Melipona bicolor]